VLAVDTQSIVKLVYLVAAVLFIVGLKYMTHPRTAVRGNLLGAAGMGLAVLVALVTVAAGPEPGYVYIVLGVVIGSLAGGVLAYRIQMTAMPQLVALFNGFGGLASVFVAGGAMVYAQQQPAGMTADSLLATALSGLIGAVTFSGSIVAFGKLQELKSFKKPIVVPLQQPLNALLAVLCVALTVLVTMQYGWVYIPLVLLSLALGFLLVNPIGGADMPVVIALLNSYSGLAAAATGFVIDNYVLIIAGSLVGASGIILTSIMCKAMNRSLFNVLFGVMDASGSSVNVDEIYATVRSTSPEDVAMILDGAQRVVFVPGYGMAVAQAQHAVRNLAKLLEDRGVTCEYAIHPVAGRMPGHMNVLLAEAGVDYDLLVEMEEINPEFQATDLALIVGACDVVNPAAITVAGTPITGMPILLTHEAKHVICCNYDDQPGYSGVKNPLYEKSHTVLLTGDAKETLHRLLEAMTAEKPVVEKPPAAVAIDGLAAAVNALASAKTVVIIPGYGMALAQAQFKVVELAAMLEKRGATVKFAIHPVAGRMPGHMNVILAEAEVDYENLLEMDTVNPQFGETDVALIFGACDVVNPAAIDVPGTPISGMPILMAHAAKTLIVCNFDTKPGYSGVANPLYDNQKSILLLGDAKKSASQLIAVLESLPT
jgi:NAD(P) transhydrogenase subunit beta